MIVFLRKLFVRNFFLVGKEAPLGMLLRNNAKKTDIGVKPGVMEHTEFNSGIQQSG